MFLRKLLSRLADNTMSSGAVITYDELKQLISSGCVQIFDVRNPEEVQNGKIPNSINIPVSELEDALKMDPAAFKQKFKAEKPKLDDSNVIFHCQLGRRGQRATEMAIAEGYKNARNYLGAYSEWAAKEGR
ncbi:thiosulfate:glutathione sulfurtransferase [Pyxicephalus adspersus]|uniref:thiosulfate:glutathione sulfurtransferase n=1 Tax=Pyxicephalus adspersus TaxID=30357 RepID=UPI003B5BE096